MKTSLLNIAIVATLSTTPLLAEDGMKCGCMKEHDAKAEMQKKMDAKMKGGGMDMNALIDEMNTTIGDKKVDAMAALLNKLLLERKAMHEKMAAMCEKMEQEKKPDGETSKPSEHQH